LYKWGGEGGGIEGTFNLSIVRENQEKGGSNRKEKKGKRLGQRYFLKGANK